MNLLAVRDGSIEHLAQGDSIDIAGMHTESDDAPGELVHDH
jgi:hypothetical protein